jgi:pimeloyl-ACP methyl ester carboxylesterase
MICMRVERLGASDGSPVLLLHGGGVAGWMWDSLAARLVAEHPVLVPDLPGHGVSANEDYRSHQDTVDALVRELARERVRAVAVIGFSLGAQLAIELAAAHPERVDRVMIVSAQAERMAGTSLTLAAMAAAAPLARVRWFARLQAKSLFIPPTHLGDYVDTSTRITRPTLLAAVGANMLFDIPTGWARFPGKALVMVGSDERALMHRSAARIHAALSSSELEVVNGSGHGIPLQRPEWFNARVEAWLSET